MGAVYRAVDQKFGSQVAIKETFYGDTHLGEAFEREARLLNGLHHPILPHVSDYFTENGGLFLVMEYIEGEDLSELLKRGENFSMDTVMGWALDLLDGLDYLHSQDPPIIHRDIKPNNLKLTPRGKIVLLDFGMAKETSSNTFAARSVFGYSRRYSPLEQIEGSGTDVRSDIFSLGASIYHLLTGEPPVDVLARASAIVAGRPDPLVPAKSINPRVPAPVSAALNSALALTPESRFASAREMSDAFERAINGMLDESSHESLPVTSLGQIDAVDVVHRAEVSPDVSGAAVSSILDGHESNETTGPRVLREEDVANPLPVIAAGTSAFNARSELRRRLSGMLPDSIPAVRIRRPTRPSYAVWLPILILCFGLALYGAYRGLTANDSTPTVATEPIASGDAQVTETPENSTTEITNPPSEVVSQPEEHASSIQDQTDASDTDAILDDADSSVASVRREGTRPASEKPGTVSKTPAASVRTAERVVPDKRASGQRPRRVVKPAFEQPAVSSIEAVMTGIPYERRRRWDENNNTWTEEERRRRRLRRAMRENRRYQYPF
jgi:serine/threonine protein kinase